MEVGASHSEGNLVAEEEIPYNKKMYFYRQLHKRRLGGRHGEMERERGVLR